MSDLVASGEQLIKAAQRVRDLGEVFTPSSTVQEMLDMLPADMWAVHPSMTFLEPSCGDGNFLVAILDRKAGAIADAYESGTLPAGTGWEAFRFHLLEALSSIYGVDISPENIDGHQSGHSIGARNRILQNFRRWVENVHGGRLVDNDKVLSAARWITWRNVQVGNMVPFDATGEGAEPPALPILEYNWNPTAGTVTVLATTIADVMAAAHAEASQVLSLFGPAEPTLAWEGDATCIHRAPVPVPEAVAATAHNGR